MYFVAAEAVVVSEFEESYITRETAMSELVRVAAAKKG
jgi:hypothetical protein